MSVRYFEEESPGAKNALLSMFVGDQIGSGAYRRVYEHLVHPEWVIKLEYTGKDFCNVHEMAVWREVKHTPIEEWFAPCIEIDKLGLCLIQARTKGFDSEKEFMQALKDTRGSTKLPDFLDDVHYGNFGIFEGRVVCHDYGFHNFIIHGVKAGWQSLAEEDGQYALL